jgi:L-2-hydroxyglutarate oxidase LhgO
VIHAGIYYPKNSLKARFCVEGKKSLYAFCTTHNIPFRQCGKLIIASKEDQFNQKIPYLYNQAIDNGVDDVKLLSQADVQYLEPEVHSKGALYSPSTGVLDSHSFLWGLLAEAEAHGATLVLRTEVESGKATNTSGRQDSHITLSVDGIDLRCQILINACGLMADKFASNFHVVDVNRSNSSKIDNNTWKPPKQYIAKGNYFRLREVFKPPFQHLVYPIPVPGGLGVHATLDWNFQGTKFGPDVEWMDPSMSLQDIILYPNPSRAPAFYKEIRTYWPNLPDHALIPDFSGLRPKLQHPMLLGGNLPFADFMIAEPKDHGIPGLFHLFGIESPGLTSSMSIASYIADQV